MLLALARKDVMDQTDTEDISSNIRLKTSQKSERKSK